MKVREKYINREISWLSFNERVLQEAADPNVPLLERLRFLGIFSNNLDEFFRVRVASVKRMVQHNLEGDALLGNYTPEQLHEKIESIVVEQQKDFDDIYNQIVEGLAQSKIFFLDETQLSKSQGVFVREYFNEKILPNLVPIMLMQTKEFPMLRDRSVYLAVKLSSTNHPEQTTYSLVRIPDRSAPRFLVLPIKSTGKYVILLDDVIRYCLEDLFPIFDYDCIEAYAFKITRDAELDIDDDISKSLLETIETSLKKRKKGSPVRMVYDEQIPEDLLNYLLKRMKFRRSDNVIPGGRYHNHRDFMDFPKIGEPHHYYQSPKSLPCRYLQPHQSILKRMKQRDFILHYPYQNFNHFISLIREAAIDASVCEISITIYRVATYSKVINALLNAARNGKKVTVIIELQARFDEEANIYWSSKLQEEHIAVINGVPGLKIHCKLALITRVEEGKFCYYAYVGTGNFHEDTARIYADEGLFTSDSRIATEVAKVFEFFKHNYKHFNYEHLVVSPFSMREFFVHRIDQEIAAARVGKPAYMIIKLNSLVDPGMIDKLYDASIAGVQVKLIIRGACSLIPGIPGLSDNIQAISIVDKYLEHSRILLFGNGGDEQLFISSADWMPRNLNRRIEVACPIYDSEIKQELKAELEIQLHDNQKARIHDGKLSNQYSRSTSNRKIRSQDEYYVYLKSIHKPEKKKSVKNSKK